MSLCEFFCGDGSEKIFILPLLAPGSSLIIYSVKPKVILICLFFAAVLPFAAAQEEIPDANGNGNGAAQNAAAQNGAAAFFLLPVLEAAFSGTLPWRPDWPADIPPDAFLVAGGRLAPVSISLSDGEETFNFVRDAGGRLREFPFFLPQGAQAAQGEDGAGHLAVEAVFAANGAMQGMTLAGEELWRVDFPSNFLPYSQMSPGGAFPMIRVYREDELFFVFIFESPGFLTETWYDSEGNLIAFMRADVIHEDLAPRPAGWRIRSAQIRDAQGFRQTEFFFDSGGNVTAARSDQGLSSALYRDARPVFWQSPGMRRELQWDGRGLLVRVRNSGEGAADAAFVPEYRFAHETDAAGNWVRRHLIEVNEVFGLNVQRAFYGQNVWSRSISAPAP